jgi:hypothetical protein
MADEPVHKRLSDEELLAELRRHRRETTEFAAALAEVQRRGDRLHADERFRAALELADDPPPRPPEDPAG